MAIVEITGKMARIIFQSRSNEHDGFYVVMSVMVENENTDQGQAGTHHEIFAGEVLEDPSTLLGQKITFTAERVEHPTYGKQYKFYDYRCEINPLEYFLAYHTKGVSKDVAAQLASRFDIDSFDKLLQTNPRELLKFKGIGEKKLERLCDSWNEHRAVRELAQWLTPLGISITLTAKIQKKFGSSAKEVLQEDPYQLTDIPGIGFKKADDIARKLGVKESSPFRVASAVLFTFDEITRADGHTWLDYETLYQKAAEFLKSDTFELSRKQFDLILNRLNEQKQFLRLELAPVFWEETHDSGGSPDVTIGYTTPDIYEKEDAIVDRLLDLYERWNDLYLSEEEERELYQLASDILGFDPDESQFEAIKTILSRSPIVAIGGYAGAGKTSITKAALELLKLREGIQDNEIHCCALSGIAANRISEASGFKASTIHAMLEFNGKRYGRNTENPLGYKVIVIDEASMIDLKLWYHLLNAIDFDYTQIIVLGDPAQLPPIGLGQVYHELMVGQGIVPLAILEKVHRQALHSNIVKVAQSVRNGEIPPHYLHFDDQSDFRFYSIDIPNRFKLKNMLSNDEYRNLIKKNATSIRQFVKNTVLNLYAYAQDEGAPQPLPNESETDELMRYARHLISFAQIITPMRKGSLGTEIINNEVQQELMKTELASAPFVEISPSFKLIAGDRVINVRNANLPVVKFFRDEISEPENKTVRVMNGQQGIIIDVDMEEKSVEVLFPVERYSVRYDLEQARNNLDLGYAITVHKSQGAQYDNVILIVATGHYVMLNNKLLYTAITRAKSNLIVAGHPFAFERACTNTDSAKRNTLAKYLIEDKVLVSTPY